MPGDRPAGGRARQPGAAGPVSFGRPLESPFGGGGVTEPGDSRTASSESADTAGDSERHRREVAELIDVLDVFFVGDPAVHVGGGMSFYYEEGNPAASVVPDVYVVCAAPSFDRDRGHVKLWQEAAVPAVVIEVVSPDSRELDQGPKKDLYARLGVTEYFLYDPVGDSLDPTFLGYRLQGPDYRAIAPRDDGSIASDVGVSFQAVDDHLRIVELATGQTLAGSDETFEELERLRSDVMRMFG